MEKIYFVMPAYNEAANIEETINQWYPVVEKINSMPDVEAVLAIANDGSKDDTYQRMESIKSADTKKYEQFMPLNKPNGGHGSTVLFLYRYALSQGADYVFQTDSDGQTNPEEFWQMFEHRHEYDFQIGYRKDRQDGSSRVFVTKTLRWVVWLMFHEWVTDANTPFRLMQRDKLKAIMEVIPEDYFLCNVAISAIAVKWKYRLKFYEITFKPRQGGVNSINMKRIIKIGWKALGDFRKINSNIKVKKHCA
jgi:glycosyltransferase involved in cell wall biosynthesis